MLKSYLLHFRYLAFLNHSFLPLFRILSNIFLLPSFHTVLVIRDFVLVLYSILLSLLLQTATENTPPSFPSLLLSHSTYSSPLMLKNHTSNHTLPTPPLFLLSTYLPTPTLHLNSTLNLMTYFYSLLLLLTTYLHFSIFFFLTFFCFTLTSFSKLYQKLFCFRYNYSLIIIFLFIHSNNFINTFKNSESTTSSNPYFVTSILSSFIKYHIYSFSFSVKLLFSI